MYNLSQFNRTRFNIPAQQEEGGVLIPVPAVGIGTGSRPYLPLNIALIAADTGAVGYANDSKLVVRFNIVPAPAAAIGGANQELLRRYRTFLVQEASAVGSASAGRLSNYEGSSLMLSNLGIQSGDILTIDTETMTAYLSHGGTTVSIMDKVEDASIFMKLAPNTENNVTFSSNDQNTVSASVAIIWRDRWL